MKRGEHGDIVVGWLVKLFISIALVGLFAFEGGAIIVANVSADDVAIKAARAAAGAFGVHERQIEAEDAAREVCERNDTELIGIFVDRTVKRVDVSVRKHANTVFVQRIGFLKRYTEVRTSESHLYD